MARKVKAARTAAVASGRGAAFKARVALAACKGDKTLGELAGQFGVHATLALFAVGIVLLAGYCRWRRQ